jgi:hypothetical protein
MLIVYSTTNPVATNSPRSIPPKPPTTAASPPKPAMPPPLERAAAPKGLGAAAGVNTINESIHIMRRVLKKTKSDNNVDKKQQS